jgi:UrcA family protein
MVMPSSTKYCTLLLAGAFGAVLAASPAFAQDVSGYGYGQSDEIVVTAPHFHAETSPLNGPIEKVSLSNAVRYDDLDLRTWQGARTLKWRVRMEARNICRTLADAYPVERAVGTSCYKDAVENGTVRADEAIMAARDNYGYRAQYYGYPANY